MAEFTVLRDARGRRPRRPEGKQRATGVGALVLALVAGLGLTACGSNHHPLPRARDVTNPPKAHYSISTHVPSPTASPHAPAPANTPPYRYHGHGIRLTLPAGWITGARAVRADRYSMGEHSAFRAIQGNGEHVVDLRLTRYSSRAARVHGLLKQFLIGLGAQKFLSRFTVRGTRAVLAKAGSNREFLYLIRDGEVYALRVLFAEAKSNASGIELIKKIIPTIHFDRR